MSASGRGADSPRGAVPAAWRRLRSGDHLLSPDRAAHRAYVHFVHELLTVDTAVRSGRIALLDADRRLAGVIERLVERLRVDHGPAGLEAFRAQAAPLVAAIKRHLRSAPNA